MRRVVRSAPSLGTAALLVALAAVPALAACPAPASRPPTRDPAAKSQPAGCPQPAPKLEPYDPDRVRSGGRPGFIDLGGGTEIRVGGRARGEYDGRR